MQPFFLMSVHDFRWRPPLPLPPKLKQQTRYSSILDNKAQEIEVT